MNIMIVLNYNDYKTTANYIDLIRDYKSLDKIIVVDNCSTDGSFLKLKKLESSKIDIIKTSENNGYASGNNFGIRYAEKIYDPNNIIISNPDIKVTDLTITNLCNFLETRQDVGVVTGIVHDLSGKIINHFAWKLPMYHNFLIGCSVAISKFLDIFSLGIIYNKKELFRNTHLQVDVVPGCFFVIKSNVMKEINYFDERTFLFQEENILAYKLKEKGYKTFILTTENIVHEESVSIKKTFKSLKSRKRINYDSAKIFLENYLQITKFKLRAYSVMYNVFKYENFIITHLKRHKDNLKIKLRKS